MNVELTDWCAARGFLDFALVYFVNMESQDLNES